jgi:hypothetical protein
MLSIRRKVRRMKNNVEVSHDSLLSLQHLLREIASVRISTDASTTPHITPHGLNRASERDWDTCGHINCPMASDDASA